MGFLKQKRVVVRWAGLARLIGGERGPTAKNKKYN